MAMVNVAMIGAGGYAFELIKRSFTEPRKLNLIAVSSNPLRKSPGRDFCEKMGIPVYPDADTLLESVAGKAEVIMIPTSIETHYPLATKCIAAGFEVFLEKPPVATVQELDGLAAHAEGAGRRVAVMFQHLYSTIVQQIKNRIVEGEFGKVTRVRAMAGWLRLDSYYNRAGWAGRLKVNGSWVLDGTINNPLAHMLANQLCFASAEPKKLAEPASVQAELYHGHDIESEDTSSVRIITTDGVEIIFNATLCSDSQVGPIITVDCEKAMIEYVNFNQAQITYYDGRRKQQIVNELEQRTYMLTQLAQCYESGEPYPVDLQMCRPFTVCVNGAFESAGAVHSIPARHIREIEHGDSIKTTISGIDQTITVCHDNGKLFSEIGVSWAQGSKPLEMDGYSEFPSRGFRL
jgi:predicted dehydrogenase